MAFEIEALLDPGKEAELYEEVESQLQMRLRELGDESLNHAQSVVYMAMHACGAIGNGGFYSYLEQDGDFAATARAYDELGFATAAEALRKAILRYPGGRMHDDYDERCIYWGTYWEARESEEDALLDEFYEETYFDPGFKCRIVDFVRDNWAAFSGLWRS
jgi:hypothetical protein